MKDKELIKQEIERLSAEYPMSRGLLKYLNKFIDSLPEETKPQFPNYESVVDKVFGAGNLESWEYEEAKKLVLLAKEELLKDLEINKESTSEDLEEEVNTYIESKFTIDKEQLDRFGIKPEDYTFSLDKEDMLNFAQHFAEWQREKDIKLEKIDDLEEFAQKWSYSNYHKELDGVNCGCLYSGVKKGAKWYESKMKETLQTEYEKGRFDMREEMMKALVNSEIVKDIHNQLSVKSEPLNDTFRNIKFGDKVKIIIVKTEQQ